MNKINRVNLDKIEYIRKVLASYEFTFVGDVMQSENFFSCHVKIDTLIYNLTYVREWDAVVVNSVDDHSGVFASGITNLLRSPP